MFIYTFLLFFGCGLSVLVTPSAQEKAVMQKKFCETVACNDRSGVIALLHENKDLIDVNSCDDDNLTPLYVAITLGNVPMVALLLHVGAKIDENSGSSNICVFVWKSLKTVCGDELRTNYEAIASLLIRYKASYALCNDLTPYYAMQRNYYDFARNLVYAGLWKPLQYDDKTCKVAEQGRQFLVCMKHFVEDNTIVFGDAKLFLTWRDYMKTACGAQKVVPVLSLLHTRFYDLLLRDYHEIVAWAQVCNNRFVLDILTGFVFKNGLFEYQKARKLCDLICVTKT